jgi:hypothetical protein
VRAAVLYRIACVLFVLFAAAHTVGFLTFKPPTPEGLAVRDAMANVHFQVNGSDLTYGGFYRAFGLIITASGLFSAFVTWQLATHPMPPIGWALCAVQVAGLVLSCVYIAAPPAVSSALVAGCVGWATWKSQAVTRS